MESSLSADARVFIGKKWRARAIRLDTSGSLRMSKKTKRRLSDSAGSEAEEIQLRDYCGMESGFILGVESNTLAVFYGDARSLVLAFSTPEALVEWEFFLRDHFGYGFQVKGLLTSCPGDSVLKRYKGLNLRLHLLDARFCLAADSPPKVLGVWNMKDILSFGPVLNTFHFRAGERAAPGFRGVFNMTTSRISKAVRLFTLARDQKLNQYFNRHSTAQYYNLDVSRRSSIRSSGSSGSDLRSWSSYENCSVFTPGPNSPSAFKFPPIFEGHRKHFDSRPSTPDEVAEELRRLYPFRIRTASAASGVDERVIAAEKFFLGSPSRLEYTKLEWSPRAAALSRESADPRTTYNSIDPVATLKQKVKSDRMDNEITKTKKSFRLPWICKT